MNKTRKNLVDAFNKGYRVVNGAVFYKTRDVKKRVNCNGYYSFCIRNLKGERSVVLVHRLVAYQKFKKSMFKKSIYVRHLDGNKLNNKEENIEIGSPTDNRLDIPAEERIRLSVHAAAFVKKHPHDEIIMMHKNGASYKEIMVKYNIKSKGTVSFIINKSMCNKK